MNDKDDLSLLAERDTLSIRRTDLAQELSADVLNLPNAGLANINFPC